MLTVTGPHVCDASLSGHVVPAGRLCRRDRGFGGTLTHRFKAKAVARLQPTCIVDEDINAMGAELDSFRCCSLHRHCRAETVSLCQAASDGAIGGFCMLHLRAQPEHNRCFASMLFSSVTSSVKRCSCPGCSLASCCSSVALLGVLQAASTVHPACTACLVCSCPMPLDAPVTSQTGGGAIDQITLADTRPLRTFPSVRLFRVRCKQ